MSRMPMMGMYAKPGAGGGGGGGGGATITPRTPIQVYDETPTGTRSFVTTGKGVTLGDFVELYWFQAGYPPNVVAWADITGWTTRANVNITGWGQFVVATRNTTVTAAEADGGSAHQIDVSISADSTELATVIQCYGGATTLDHAAYTLGGSSDFLDPSVINLPGFTTTGANSYYTLACPVRTGTPAWDTAAAVAAGYTVLGAFTTGTHVNFVLLGKFFASASTVQAATTVTSAGIQYEYATAIGKV